MQETNSKNLSFDYNKDKQSLIQSQNSHKLVLGLFNKRGKKKEK